jgi:Xaa-Pro aminopeptidase
VDITREKIAQAVGLLSEMNLDAWMLFGRETAEMGDPSLKMVSPAHVVWQSAFIFGRNGERIAIVGHFDAEIFRRSGLYSEVIGYNEGIGADLRAVLARLDPRHIALNYSVSNHAADGLSYGMFLTLQEALSGTPYAGRFVSAEDFVACLRGRKSAGEVTLIGEAVRVTEQLFVELGAVIRPGWTERDIAVMLAEFTDALGLTPGWDPQSCPVVNAGPNADSGHAGPTDQPLERGHVLHIDYGVRKDGYCSDLQRVWYLRRQGERRAPASVQRAFAAVRRAIEAGAAALKPGVPGWQVDEAARRSIVADGYPAFQHALGHQMGMAAHDGSTILGPRWERYGKTPFGLVEEGYVYTLELSAQTEAGVVGLEEDVVVTEHGCHYLSTPQTEMWYV